jgi:hypothetical protein
MTLDPAALDDQLLGRLVRQLAEAVVIADADGTIGVSLQS